jgi:hypothetical protein
MILTPFSEMFAASNELDLFRRMTPAASPASQFTGASYRRDDGRLITIGDAGGDDGTRVQSRKKRNRKERIGISASMNLRGKSVACGVLAAPSAYRIEANCTFRLPPNLGIALERIESGTFRLPAF